MKLSVMIVALLSLCMIGMTGCHVLPGNRGSSNDSKSTITRRDLQRENHEFNQRIANDPFPSVGPPFR